MKNNITHYTPPAEVCNSADFEREEEYAPHDYIAASQSTVIATALLLADKLIKQS